VTLPTVPGVWQPGDAPASRRVVPVLEDGLHLEAGGRLPRIDVAYETWGKLNAGGTNGVLVLHALTGDSHVAGGPDDPGWWQGLVGPGRPIDTNRYFVVCPNVLGGCQGTTGPASEGPDGRPHGGRFPTVTIGDQVTVEAALADQLGIDRWAGMVGGSMGGMRALEWCVSRPERVARAVVVAAPAASTAEQIALCSLQVRAIRADPAFHGGDYYDSGERPTTGMAIARGFGHLTYRTAEELQLRFGRQVQDEEDPLKGGRFAVESYLEHAGDKLGRRFDPNSYVVLSEAMNHHDVGRHRGGVAQALARVTAQVTVAGITSDRLYPLSLQQLVADGLPGRPEVHAIDSTAGHDGFLVEIEAVGALVRSALS
jgi:homoserine O-acetyltransferase